MILEMLTPVLGILTLPSHSVLAVSLDVCGCMGIFGVASAKMYWHWSSINEIIARPAPRRKVASWASAVNVESCDGWGTWSPGKLQVSGFGPSPSRWGMSRNAAP
jgi:hypothetical protein